MNSIVISLISSGLLFYLLSLSYNTYYARETVNCFILNKKNFYLLQSGYALAIDFLKKNKLEILEFKEKTFKLNPTTSLQLSFRKKTEVLVEISGKLLVNFSVVSSYYSVLNLENFKYVCWQMIYE